MGGWLGGLMKNKAISAFNLAEVEVEVEAELGKISEPKFMTLINCKNSRNF